MSDEMLRRLKTRLGRAKAERRSIVDRARNEQRSDDQLTNEETTEFRALTRSIEELEERIDELTDEEKRTQAANAAARFARGSSPVESSVYTREGRASYFADLVTLARGFADPEARQRLELHQLEQRDLNRADGSGGQFVPPAWVVGQYVGVPRPGRVTADLLDRRPLPAGTDSINIPKLVTGTATAIQPADNDPVQEVDVTDTVLTAPVRTIAGQQDVAIQLLEQSPVNFDEIIMRDLMADFSRRLNLQVLSGTGTAGQLLGLRNVTGIETVTWTSASPTAVELQRRVADAIQRIMGALFTPPNAIVMHPRRWAWLLTQNDASSRPLVVPDASGASNSLGSVSGTGEGRAGTFAGLPVYLDASIPTNLGTGANEDVILVLNTAETILYESSIRTRVLPEVLSGTLTVRLQIYGHVAQATRQAKSVAVITGSGLVPPAFT